MSTIEAARAPEVERLSWMEICERYPLEWVVLVEIAWIDLDNFEFQDAIVLGHSKIRGAALKSARPVASGYESFGYYWTGPIRAIRYRDPSRHA